VVSGSGGSYRNECGNLHDPTAKLDQLALGKPLPICDISATS
jgi:hypothetical protein